MSTSLSVLLTLPFLAIISIPLVISAWITISLSLLALILRLLIIYLELCFAIIANFFVIPTATNISLLNLSASEPSTPASSTPKRLSIDHGATRPPPPTLTAHQHQHHHQPYHHHSHHLAHSLARAQSTKRPNHATRTNSASTSSDDQQDNNIPSTRLCKEPSQRNGHVPASAAAAAAGLLGLISGDSGRDFEGLGGWRSPPPPPPPPSTSRYHHLSGTHSLTTTPNGLLRDDNNNINNDTDGEDERAWLSINRRLELPSQPLTLRSNSSTSELVEPSFWRPRRPSQEQHPPPPSHQGGGRHRHHHRSATTSSLQVSKLSTRSLFLSLSSRPEPGVAAAAAAAPPEPPRGLRALSPSSSSIHQLPSFPETALSADSHPSSAVLDVPAGPGGGGGSGSGGGGGGGYFAARPTAASRASPNSSGTVTPVEGGQRSPWPPGKSMVHYSTGLRYRRRSISGPNSGVHFLQP
ncbi:hypothetical protein BO86DRAFT_387851 [Aspergillus japonicus CBS 114.51]|uniref:Uncharacterized protein n=1 Tax=Aspergillus japonicus CBS 114.51 TaxID=1448312 RepID=A0A8T8X5Z1_ASPJA|nr:hypothetical protein BO86DRAFT_387851 [Aspergillus japonicus CBS 114.51]RAH83587.1 hypothetical protein BO86DRAFT_387851 [Aspergillus japonicus CBS 114.51]